MNEPASTSANQRTGDSRFFSTGHLNHNLKTTSLRGGLITFTTQIIKLFLQTASTMILARLLTPQDFGLIAMVASVTGFILIFKDLGLSMATIQKDNVTHEQISTLFWINVVLSILLLLITMALSPLVAWFYRDPRLTAVTIALAGGFILSGLTVQHQSLLSRQMRFKTLAFIEILSLLAGIVTALACSWFGLKYWSLVFMNLAIVTASMIGSWIACGWRPGWPRKGTGVRPMIAFGGHLTAFNLINYFARNLDNILIGRFWGSLQVGLYSKAYSMLLLPLTQITVPMANVAIPTLSRLQHDPERYRRFYLKAVKLIAYVAVPLVVMMIILSKEMVLLVLGDQWRGAVPIFRILAICAFFQPIGSTVGWIYISLGQTKRMAKWGMFACPIICLFIVLGLQWGAIGVAASYSIAIMILFYPQFSMALRHSPIQNTMFFGIIFKPVMLGLLLAMPLMIVKFVFSSLSLIGIVSLEVLCMLILLPLIAYFVNPIKKDIGEIIVLAKSLLVGTENHG